MAAANQFTKWLQIHPQFYVHCPFIAHGKATAWCPVCYLDNGNHSYDCPRFTFIQTFPSVQLSSLLWSILPPPSHPILHLPYPGLHPPTHHTYPSKTLQTRPLHPFNKNKGSCPHGADCRFIHKCTRWQGGRSTLSHPAPTSLLETSLHMNYSFAACITSFIKIQLPHYHLSMTTLVL